ncbi:MAG TPA: glycosyltransferase family 87 protein [Gemmatimonadaceae bacterium]|nr:glycosyltransferase family 87 protein [Gemmatimonadaceae bacterium]
MLTSDAPNPPSRRLRVGGYVLATVWVAAVLVTSLQAGAHRNNNFLIFLTAWDNLRAGRDMYAASGRHFDIFAYSPTFALLFAPFAALPFTIGVLLWNGVNAAALYWALGRVLTSRGALVARAIVFLDTVGAMQNVQSNALLAGLMIIAFAELERRHESRAAWAIGLGAAIKIFPLAAAIPGVFTPYRIPRLAIAGLLVAAILVAAPLLVTSPAALSMQYHQWAAHSSLQSATLRGYSVMEHLHLWLGVDWPNKPIQVIGVVILLAPLSQIPHWGSERFRRLFLASVLMFCVLFNHKSESPSFVIALAGVGIWFALSARRGVDWGVLAVVFVGTVLSASDAMPEFLQQRYFQPYRLKTLPVLLVWILTQVELWTHSVKEPFAPLDADAA